ncbi:MAG: phosphatase PAP2 family protein [Labilithrix sp.]|nr:phosphatase PAP2 family protein [Labilithrix sp.]MBX3221637.1 phosphatase PAP2 family protein [Labilithrix sp.]
MIEIDVHFFRLLHHALADWIGPMVVLSAIGGGWGSLAVVPLFASARTRRFALSLAAVLGVTAVLVFSLKRVVGRVRPCNCLADVKARVFDAPSDFSFPSGHSAGSFAFAVFVAIVLYRTIPEGAPARTRRLRRLAAFSLPLVAALVGLSRIALGVHFPGDVLAGAVLGTTVAVLGAHRHLAGLRRREALTARGPVRHDDPP